MIIIVAYRSVTLNATHAMHLTLHDTLHVARHLSGMSEMGVLPSWRNCQTTALRLARDSHVDSALRAKVTSTVELLQGMAMKNATLPDQARAKAARQQCNDLLSEWRETRRMNDTQGIDPTDEEGEPVSAPSL